MTSGPASAQHRLAEEDTHPSNNVQITGGYGAPILSVTSINGGAAMVVGAQGGVIFNRHFVAGAAVRGLSTLPTPQPDASIGGRPAEVQLGYGGLMLEYIGAPTKTIQYGAGVVVGGGSAHLVSSDYDPQEDESLARSAIFVARASGRLEFPVTPFFHLGAEVGYQFVSGSELPSVSDADLGGPVAELSFRFGSF
jgi:hypothetical protein